MAEVDPFGERRKDFRQAMRTGPVFASPNPGAQIDSGKAEGIDAFEALKGMQMPPQAVSIQSRRMERNRRDWEFK
jgi:DNA-binding LacI/PurR family transcriptional regulator